ncbi:MAG: N-acetylmuramoyl-L-alanine amidase [Myxococcota bacterium]
MKRVGTGRGQRDQDRNGWRRAIRPVPDAWRTRDWRRAFGFGLLVFLGLFAPASNLWAAPAASAAAAYEDARSVYFELKSDPKRQQFRHHWERSIAQFLRIAQKFPKSSEAPRALYTAATLTHDLYEVSRRPADRKLAVERYQRVASDFAKSSLADDALYQAATLSERAGASEQAKTLLSRLLDGFPKGDMVGQAQRMLKKLGAEASRVADLGSSAKSKPKPKPKPEPEPSSARASQTDFEQRLTVVLDPGHGGRDHGATGQGGLKEKTVNLEITKRIRRRLEAQGIRVVMTRTGDQTVSLNRRAQLASEAQADLMVSVHANAAPTSKAHGIETYYLDVTHSRYAKRLAHRENERSKQNPDELNLILADLTKKVSTRESKALAVGVQKRMIRAARRVNSKARDLGAKPAMLHVLMAARCPAILIETAFVSNPRDATMLRRADYQDALATAVASGISAHLKQPLMAQIDSP